MLWLQCGPPCSVALWPSLRNYPANSNRPGDLNPFVGHLPGDPIRDQKARLTRGSPGVRAYFETCTPAPLLQGSCLLCGPPAPRRGTPEGSCHHTGEALPEPESEQGPLWVCISQSWLHMSLLEGWGGRSFKRSLMPAALQINWVGTPGCRQGLATEGQLCR